MNDEYMVCEDCFLAAAGYDSHEAGRDLSKALSKLGDVWLTTGTEEMAEEFSRTPCEGCGSELAGRREKVFVIDLKPGQR